MNKKKYILVTGGAGFIGSHTVTELIGLGFEPVIADDFRNSDHRIVDGIEKITAHKPIVRELDVCDKPALKRLFEEFIFSGVIHFAADKAVGESVGNPLKYYSNNVVGLLNCLELCEEFEVVNFVFSSSCTVYGEPDEEIVNEKTLWKEPSSPYAATKQICERIMNDLNKSGSEMRLLSLRYFNPIGAHPSGEIGELPIGKPNNLLPFITQTAIGIREELIVFGNDYPTKDGTCIRDYIHVMDLATAHAKGLSWLQNQTAPIYEAINLGTGTGSSILEIIHTFEEVSGKKLSWKFGNRRSGDVSRIYADVSKSMEIIGWRAKYTIKDAVSDAWNWELKLNDTN